MSEWRSLKMADVMAEFYDGPHATPPPADDGPVYLGIKNITDGGLLNLTDVRHIAEHDFARWTKRVAPLPGDIVFTYEATLHRYALIPDGFRGCLGRRLALIRPDRSVVHPRYLHFAMLGPEWRTTVTERIISGSTVDRIPILTFPDFPISVPPLDYQELTAEILGTLDDLIENNRRRVGVLEEMARAIYREWFVRFRYPGHEEDRLVDSPLGPIPEGWEAIPASLVLDINPKVQLRRGTRCRHLTMGDLDERTMNCEPSGWKDSPTGSKFENGDTLFARITPCLENGKTGFVQALGHGEAACGSTEFIVLRGRLVGPAFTYLLARSDDLRGHAVSSMSGASGRQRVRNECFDSFLIAAPSQAVAATFEVAAEPLFRESWTLHRQGAALARVRDLLLPKLVTGQIDVSHLDLSALAEAATA